MATNLTFRTLYQSVANLLLQFNSTRMKSAMMSLGNGKTLVSVSLSGTNVKLKAFMEYALNTTTLDFCALQLEGPMDGLRIKDTYRLWNAFGLKMERSSSSSDDLSGENDRVAISVGDRLVDTGGKFEPVSGEVAIDIILQPLGRSFESQEELRETTRLLEQLLPLFS